MLETGLEGRKSVHRDTTDYEGSGFSVCLVNRTPEWVVSPKSTSKKTRWLRQCRVVRGEGFHDNVIEKVIIDQGKKENKRG